MAEMTEIEKRRLLRLYLGVQGGYLGDFDNIGVLERFYIQCNIDADPRSYDGTNREKFEQILNGSPANIQAAIIRGALKFHPPDPERWATRTQELADELFAVADRLEGTESVPSKKPRITSASVERAINDAEELIQTTGATSAVDRVHTMLHGYLRAVCDDASIEYREKALMSGLFALIRRQHPSFSNVEPRAQDLEKVFRSMAGIMDAMNPIRNEGSMAHPNEELLNPPEASLVINMARTILHYVDMKVEAAAS